MTAIPTVYIAHQESIEPDCQWKEAIDLSAGIVTDSPKENQPDDPWHIVKEYPLDSKPVEVTGIGTAYVPTYFTEKQVEKAISILRKETPKSPDWFVANAPKHQYECTVQWKANRPKVVLYSTLGLSLGFVLIQGGFRMILWVIAGFRNT